MDTDEDRVLLPVLDRYSFIERNENVGGSRHDGFDLGFAELLIEPLGHVQGHHFFRRPRAAISADVFSAVTGIHHDGLEAFAGVLGAAAAEETTGSRTGGERAEQNDK